MGPQWCVAAIVLFCLGTPAWATSLYHEKTYQPLVTDNKAFRVGDIVTVQVMESATASSNADTTTRRSNRIAGSIGSLSGARHGGDIGVTGEFDGGGRTQRTGKLLAQLSLTVKEVFPNGDMRIGGEQRLTVNNELQRIFIEGRVRAQDITEGNIVASSRLADANIIYLGDGALNERQKRSWWRGLLDGLGL